MAALTGPQGEIEAMVAEFKVRRDLMVEGLNALPGVTCFRPRGAFYVFPNIKGTGMKSADLAKALLEQAGIASLSGATFGEHGEGYLRFSYANSLANLQTALHSLGEYLSVRAR
jgi:aspartate aminotransferase